ncbi:MAG: oligosaccharide flippase family protein [archaeon]|nr:oligosaccharide flippase family protein [archaeon]
MTETDMSTESSNQENTIDRGRNITRGLGSLTIQNILTSGLAFVFLAVLLRLVPYGDYNAYSSAQVSVGIAVVVSTFGLSYAATRYVAFFQAEEEKAWGAARSILLLSLIFTTVVTAVFELLSGSLSVYFTKSTDYAFFFELAGAWLFSYSISTILQGIIQGMKRYILLAKMLLVSRILMVGFTVVMLELSHNIDYVVIAWVVYFAIMILWPLKIIWHNLFLQGSKEKYNQYSTIMRYTAPLGIAGVFSMLSSSGDSVILGGYTQSLGVYNAVVTISSILSIVLVFPLITTLLPEASSSAKTSTDISNGTRLALRFLILGLLPVSLLVASVSNQLLSLFSGGGNYLQGTEPLELIAATFVFVGIQSVGYSILLALGKTVQASIVAAVMALADISLALLLVPSAGILGATTSKVAVAAIGMLVTLYFVRMHLRNLDSYLFYLKGIVAAVIPSLVVFTLSTFVSNRIISLVPYAVLWAILFLICAKALRIFSEEDRSFVAHLTPAALQKFIRYL